MPSGPVALGGGNGTDRAPAAHAPVTRPRQALKNSKNIGSNETKMIARMTMWKLLLIEGRLPK